MTRRRRSLVLMWLVCLTLPAAFVWAEYGDIIINEKAEQ